MSIQLTVFDIFSYTMPGLGYMYVYWRISRIIGIGNAFQFDVNVQYVIVILMIGYVIGILMDSIVRRGWWHDYRQNSINDVLDKIREENCELGYKLKASEYHVYRVFVTNKNTSNAEVIEKMEAITILLRNISCSLALLCAAEICSSFISSNVLEGLFLIVTTGVFAVVGTKEAIRFEKQEIIHVYNCMICENIPLNNLIDLRKNV
ncbi:MAG: hypothetical protein K8S62_12735 [Candidatus Sabulitectum sp.]|nr:hypothetical protein [Candidatus Sabulitectum sp.]